MTDHQFDAITKICTACGITAEQAEDLGQERDGTVLPCGSPDLHLRLAALTAYRAGHSAGYQDGWKACSEVVDRFLA